VSAAAGSATGGKAGELVSSGRLARAARLRGACRLLLLVAVTSPSESGGSRAATRDSGYNCGPAPRRSGGVVETDCGSPRLLRA
jgi:hypothetical protein